MASDADMFKMFKNAVEERDVPGLLDLALSDLDSCLMPGYEHRSKRPAMQRLVASIFAAAVIHVSESGTDGLGDLATLNLDAGTGPESEGN